MYHCLYSINRNSLLLEDQLGAEKIRDAVKLVEREVDKVCGS